MEPEQELARRLAGTAARRAADRERIDALVAASELEVALEHLRYQRSALPAYERLAERVGPAGAARVRAVAEELRRVQGVQAAVAEAAAAGLTRRLDDAGIRSTTLKGVALSRALYDDPAARPSADVDVLVGREDLGRAVAELTAPGGDWTLATPSRRLPRLHHELRPQKPWLPPVELHWRLHWYEEAFSRRLLEATDEVDGIRRPQREHELLALLLFFERDGFLGVRLAADLAAWWDRHGARIDPAVVGALVADHPRLAPALTAAALVADDLVGVPAHVVLDHVGARRSSRRVATAVRLANPAGRGSRTQQAADVDLVDALLAPTGALPGALRRALLPGRRHILGPVERPAVRRATLVATHPFKTGARMAWAVARASRPAPAGLPSG